MKLSLAVTSLALVLCLVLSGPAAFGQATNATLTGTVSDGTGARIPGVDVNAQNNATGVTLSTITNNAGAYTIQNLIPGLYTVTADLPGFETSTYTDVTLRQGATFRLDIELAVQGATTAIEVSVAGDQVLLETSSTVGDVLETEEIASLPLVGNSVLDLVTVMAGVTMTDGGAVFGQLDTEFAGVSAENINISRDGISVSSQRWPIGVAEGSTELNPDLVGEVRMILAPVDAELGRGNGQVQVSTKSGTNEFHGALDWNVQNSVLDANSWANNNDTAAVGECGNNRQVVLDARAGGSSWCPSQAPWRNVHEGTASLGGPIVENQTHFFALYNQKWTKTRTTEQATVMTPCARNGIFRYWDDWNNGNADVNPSYGGANPTIPVVDDSGNPVMPQYFPNTPLTPGVANPGEGGDPYTGQLRAFSVFGPLAAVPTAPDCSDAVINGAPFDAFRTQMDPTGTIQSYFLGAGAMPLPNNYEAGDGLNTAGFRWTRTLDGADNLWGIGEPTQRKQINVKIDHIINDSNRFNVGYSYETTDASDSFMHWPDTYEGRSQSRPHVLTFNMNSTLSSTMVNEARFGMTRTGVNVWSPLNLPENQGLRDMLPVMADGVTLAAPKSGTSGGFPDFGGGIEGARGTLQQQTQRDSTPRYTIGDTLSLLSGSHSLKFGGEFRHASSKSWIGGDFFQNATSQIIVPAGGATFTTTPDLNGVSPFMVTNNEARAEGMLNFLSGSLASVGQYRYINDPNDAGVQWNDPLVDDYRIRDFHVNEFASFFKDDWKVLDNLTLNLGLRWDYYGPPYEKQGMAGTLVGGGEGVFGISGTGFNNWWTGDQAGSIAQLVFVGKNSPNPGIHTIPRDTNNFGPAIGFAWNFDNATTVRGGYQLTYIGAGNMDAIDGNFGSPPGSANSAYFFGEAGNEYLDYTDLQVPYIQGVQGVPNPVVPVNVNGGTLLPVEPIPVEARSGSITVYDTNYVNPYVQNLTLSVNRRLTRNFNLDVRYVGTLSRKNYTTFDVNQANFINNGLIDAFDAARAGGTTPLLDQMFMGVNVGGGTVGGAWVGGVHDGVVDPGDFTGGDVLRGLTTSNVRGELANGDYDAIADTLATLNYSSFTNPDLPAIPNGVQGAVLRVAEDAGGNPIPGKVAQAENLIWTNPQFGTANLQTNGGHSNYHSLQIQGTLRPTYGVNLTTSYTWAKNLGVSGNTYTDPRNREADYTFTGNQRDHVFRTYGTFNLPIGPGQLVAGNSSGVLARAVEGWSMSWIFNASSGERDSIDAQDMMWDRGTPDQVAAFDFNDDASYNWAEGANQGNLFQSTFTQVADPQCASVAASIAAFCTLDALADGNGNIILQHPTPGTKGNMGELWLIGIPEYSLDASMSKSFQVGEGIQGQLRVDAQNVLNNPTPGTPALSLASGTFGQVNSRGSATSRSPGYRQWQLRLRIDF